jgi:hypothetical protein
MSYVKTFLFDRLSQMGIHSHEEADDYMIEAAMREMSEIMEQHTLPDYVVLTNKQRCYLGNECDPINDVCSCG